MEREAIRIFTETASDDAIAAQRAAHEEILTRAKQNITAKLIEKGQIVDLDFHEAIIDHLGNDIISKSYRVNWIKIRLIRHGETGLLPHLVVPVMEEHLRIVAAIERRDPNAASAELTAHITGSRDRALGLK